MPLVVVRKIIKIQREFLWGEVNGGTKIAWLNWERVCQPKEAGGLGIRNIKVFNIALLSKWRWRLFEQKQNAWCRVLRSKYGTLWDAYPSNITTKLSWWWRDLVKVTGGLDDQGWFQKNVRWKLGNGATLNMWHHWWEGEEKLLHKFPRIYLNSEQKFSVIADMGRWEDGSWVWDFKWRREWFEWEKSAAQQFLNSVQIHQPQAIMEDSWVWGNSSTGSFSVKYAYQLLSQYNLEEGNKVFKWIWRIPAPSNIKAFVWMLILDRTQTKDNLLKRNVRLVELDLDCPLCNCHMETISHLFFTCELAWLCWNRCYKWLRVFFVQHEHPTQHLSQHQVPSLSYAKMDRCRAIWCAVVWNLWLHRNRIVFKQERWDLERVWEACLFQSWQWLRCKSKGFSASWYQWLQQPLECIKE